MTGLSSRLAPVVFLAILAILFLYLTQPPPVPLPFVHPDHNFDPTVVGPLFAP
ncbi:MAG: hypothetical protein KJN71_06225 [Acidimicrobiia bacterium]|nr:hypothetical protein [Acidimicrobiia bacterium]NNC75492.1 hypothetical protein [Acidimicrobiia bacterium]